MTDGSPTRMGISSPGGGPKILTKKKGTIGDRAQAQVEKVTNKITFDNMVSGIQNLTADKNKRKEDKVMISAAVGVVHSYSLVLTHLVAPLWAVGVKPIGVVKAINFHSPDIQAMAASMDKKGCELEIHLDSLQGNPTLATAFLTLLVARLLSVEHDEDYHKKGFADALSAIVKDVKHTGEYEEHFNDETVAHDQPRRKLIEVGGTWRRACANDHGVAGSQLRRKLLASLMLASVVTTYVYNDESLQFMCDALASQLFLLSYSESLVTLVAGTKGPQYVAKYILFLSPPSAERVVEDCIIADCSVTSNMLQEISNIVYLAVFNLVHRNDTSEVLIMGMQKAIAVVADKTQLPSLFTTCIRMLHRTYAADLGAVVGLLNTIRPMVVYPAPVGTLALSLMKSLVEAIRSVNSLQRRLGSSIFVAGAEMRSFRRQPAHIITAPYCSRSYVFQRIYLGNIDTQRGINPAWPTVIESGIDPLTGQPSQYPTDDVVQYIANSVSNVFQSVYELTNGVDALQETANAIGLRDLFGIPGYALTPYYPSVLTFLNTEKNYVSDAKNTNEQSFEKVAELYMTVVDHNKPVKGAARLRLESPRPPMYPLTHIVSSDGDDMNDVVKHTIDKHWRYCDQRVMEKETAALHPKKELSLSHFIEGFIRLVVAGGGGMLRRIITSILHMRTMYPGAVPNFKFYVLPLGYSNDVPSWLARCDPLYKQRVFDPYTSLPQRQVESPAVDAMNGTNTANFDSLNLRQRLNDYLLDATVPNELIVYQLEGTTTNGVVQYIPFVSNVEFGVHLQQAVQTEEVVHSVHEGIGTSSFSSEVNTRRNTANTKQSSSPNLNSMRGGANAMGGGGPTGVSNSSFSGPSNTSLTGSNAPLPSARAEVVVGETRETVDRIKVRIHGHRGLPLATKRHPAEPVDILNVASGVDILDWISTTYHQYEPGAALKMAQLFLDKAILRTEALPATGKEASFKFQETGLYSVADRECPDDTPLVAGCNRSKCFDAAMGIKEYLEDPPANTQTAQAAQPQPLKMKLTFTSIPSDITYRDLSDPATSPVRDVLGLKLKSTGSCGDMGSHPDPTNLMLHMSINEIERRRPARIREKVDQHEHYQLRFGEGQRVDPKVVLHVESKLPPTVSGTSAGGVMCAADGDIFGPFLSCKIRPITTSTQQSRRAQAAAVASGGAAAAAASKEPNVATITVMSFLKPHSS